MVCKWTLFFSFCVLLTSTKGSFAKNFLWAEKDIKIFIKENIDDFKVKLQQQLEKMNLEHSLLNKNHSSQPDMQLSNCVELLGSHLANRRSKIIEITSKSKTVWMSSNNVTISSVKVNGEVFSRRHCNIRRLNSKINASSHVSLNKMTKTIVNRVKLLQNDMEKTLFKSNRQLLKGKLTLKNVIVHKCTINELNNHVIVNELPSSRLTSILKKKGNQKFQNKLFITNLSSGKTIVRSLNRNKMEDYIRLKPGRLSVNGSYAFGNVSTRTIFVHGTINGLKINNFVLVSKEQDIYDLKYFARFSAKNIRTGFVNEIFSDDLRKVKEDSTSFPSVLKFSDDLIIQGNLQVFSLNGNDVMQLFLNTVNIDREQNIAGKKSFKSVVIDGSMIVARKINNCTLDQFMTINTNQPVYGAVKFLRTSIFQNILADLVNGIDLSQQAVIRNRSNAIRGVKTFTKNLTVSNIFMKEGVRIDSFDPSTEKLKLIKTNDLKDRKFYWFDSISIENMNATEVEIDAKYFTQLKNLENVWLRRTEQNISFMKTKNMQVNNLNATKVNNISIEDLVTVKGNAIIQGPVHFIKKIFTKTLNLGVKKNVNFSPEYWNKGKVKISNNITIDTAVLRKNLMMDGPLRTFESGFILSKEYQRINGHLQFEKVKVKDLSVKDLNFNIINNINITQFLDRAIVVPIGKKSVRHKHFKALNGSSMICNGVLNNILLEKVVLKNSVQNITAPWMFMNPPSFKKIQVKKLLDDVRLENVIYVNEHGVISNKTFNGSITTSHLYVSGYINGINVSHVQQEAFNKSRTNFLKERLTFYGNITANKLQANEIDYINLGNVILLNATQRFKSLYASDITAKNLSVFGRINRCDIKWVVANAFTVQDLRNISSRTMAKSLVIEGNLKINYLLGERFSDWISFLNLTSSSEIEDDTEFESLKADTISFSQLLNNIAVDYLMNDAVKKKEYQIILGRKDFQEIEIQDSFIQALDSNKTCGVNATEMFELYINRNDNGTFTLLSPSIKSLAARQVTVRGMLNGLRLPFDVVLSNVNEIIEPQVIINNSVNTTMDLKISGKINGRHFRNFLQERVTLNTAQEIFSTINFTEDIDLRGNTGLNGTINKLRLENALKKNSNRTIAGNKCFANTWKISADVTVKGFINGIYFEQLLRCSKNESLKEVLFYKLNTSDLICHTINGVNIDDLHNYTHIVVHDVNETLDNITSDILLLQDSLRIQKDALDYPISMFSYFELHELIKFGPVLKFLPVYEYGMIGEKYELQVTQMVMWVNKKVNGCRKITSLIADVSPNGTLKITKKMPGKVFPFSLQVEKEDVVGFYVQAEYSRTCSSKVKNLIIKSIFSSDFTNNSKITLPEGSNLVDVQLLELQEVFLIVALNTEDPGERIFIYHYDAFNNSWSQYQQFYFQNLTSIEFILVEREDVSFYNPPDVFLSVTGDGKNSGVTVYEWDFEAEEFFLKTKLSTTVSTHALWLYAHRNLYLLLAKERIELTGNHSKIDVFNESLEVYTFDEDELILSQIVNIRGVRFLDSFMFAGEIFILATSSHMEVVYILQFRGYNGFEVIQEIPSAGITEARVFTVDSNLYLALNSRTIQSRILKTSVRGGRLFVAKHFEPSAPKSMRTRF